MTEAAEYRHKEAFCLMLYRCESCGCLEAFWNSRDGVTPFIVGGRCLRCAGDMQHIDWQHDTCVPNHIPYRGQGVFIDMPESLKRPLALRRVEVGRQHGYEAPEDIVEQIIAGFHPGEPWFIRW